MEKITVLIFLTFGILVSKPNKGYTVFGDVKGFPDSTLVYLESPETNDIFEKSYIINGKFFLEGKLHSEPQSICLNLNFGNECIYYFLYIGNENIYIKGNKKDFRRNINVIGSKFHKEYNNISKMTIENDIKRDSLLDYLNSMTPELQEKNEDLVIGKIRKIDSLNEIAIKYYILNNINTFHALNYLSYYLNLFSLDTIRMLFEKVSPKLKKSKYGEYIQTYIKSKVTKLGDICQDFVAFDINGKPYRFLDFKSKYLLLDFTGANCGPCIESAKELRAISNKYKDSLLVISFSDDFKKETWLNSIKRDTITWLSLNDGKGRNSKTLIEYGIHGIPTFFIINENKKVIYTWSGYSEGIIEEKLKEFLKN